MSVQSSVEAPTSTAASGEHAAVKTKVFISYSRKDMAFADRLEAALAARGFASLIDREEKSASTPSSIQRGGCLATVGQFRKLFFRCRGAMRGEGTSPGPTGECFNLISLFRVKMLLSSPNWHFAGLCFPWQHFVDQTGYAICLPVQAADQSLNLLDNRLLRRLPQCAVAEGACARAW
jgi:hypothetical protein